MDRQEAVLRELNLYPLWKRRNQSAPVAAELHAPEELLAVRPEPVEGRVFVAGVVRQAHHERPNEQSWINNDHADLSAVISASKIDNLGWPELKQQVRDCTACKLRAGC